MSNVVIIGAGPVGAAVAQRLCVRGRIRGIRLIDAKADVAAGKALDIRQSGPIDLFDTDIAAGGDVLAAVGASAIVIADSVEHGAWRGEDGLALVRQLVRAGTTAPFVFACGAQIELMEAAYRELKVPAPRLLGTAPSAIVGAVRAIAGVELNLSHVDLTVVGRPPHLVVGWSAATVAGALVTDRIQGHRLLSISQSLTRLWPPGPYAIGSATAAVVEALLLGSRHLHPALTIVDGELGARGAAVMLPLQLGQTRVLGHVLPSLSPQEKTEMQSGLTEVVK